MAKAKTNLKRMNRFELLELMYRLVVENEKLSRRCSELESMLASSRRRADPYPARNGYASAEREQRPATRREEILARVDEQSSVPARRHEADVPSGRASPSTGAAPARAARSASAPQQKAPASRPAAQPKASAARPAQQTVPRAPAKAPPPDDDFDIDSILEDYFSDMALDRKGRDA